MSQFTGTLADFEASIKDMREYLANNTQARPLHEVEAELFALALATGREALAAYVAQVGTGDVGPVHVDVEGRRRKRHGHPQSLTYRSIFGPISIMRTYYYHRLHGGYFPLDEQFSLPERSYSYLLQKWAMRFAVEDPYGEGADDLAMLLGVQIPKRAIEEMVVETAPYVAPFRAQLAPPAAEGTVLVIEADGKGVRMVRPKTDEPGPKMRLTKGQKRNKKKMATVFTVYTMNPVEGCLPEPIARKVYAFMGTKREAFKAFAAEAMKRGYGRLKTLFLSDGDPDLATLQAEFFLEAEPCVDWIHVVGYLWSAAYVFHPEGSPEARAWVKEREGRLMANDVSTVIRGLKQSLTKGKKRLKPSHKETLSTVIGFLQGVRDRIPYQEWYAAGYPIGTGSVEGACRHLVEDRMDRAGMKWKESGAQAILDIRCVLENGEMDEFTKFRIKREHERLYGRKLSEGLAA